MRKLISWLSSWAKAANIARRVDRIDRTVVRLNHTRQRSATQLRNRARELIRIQDLLLSKVDEISADLDQARSIQRQYNEQLETIRSEKTVLETMVAALIAANAVFTERWHAETAIQVMRQVAHQPGQGEQ